MLDRFTFTFECWLTRCLTGSTHNNDSNCSLVVLTNSEELLQRRPRRTSQCMLPWPDNNPTTTSSSRIRSSSSSVLSVRHEKSVWRYLGNEKSYQGSAGVNHIYYSYVVIKLQNQPMQVVKNTEQTNQLQKEILHYNIHCTASI